MKYEYPFTVTPAEEGGFLIQFIDLPEAYTESDSEDESFYMAGDVLNLSLECRLDDNKSIPAPSVVDTKYKISPSVAIQAAIAVRNAKDETRKNTSDLARAMGVTWPVADKLTDPRHFPSLRQLDKAARALGKRLTVSFDQNQPHDLNNPVITTPAMLPAVAIPVPISPMIATTTAGLL